MVMLKFVDSGGNGMGLIKYDSALLIMEECDVSLSLCVWCSWFAVHCTSMNNSNRLVSSDNKGLASLMMERYKNGDALPGRVRKIKKEHSFHIFLF